MTVDGKAKLKPALDGDYWMIGDNPDLGELDGRNRINNTGFSGSRTQECVDHHVFQSEDGKWHLWGCIRGTAIGRILYHWEADNLTDTHWLQTGENIRADKSAGENLDDWFDEEWIQSPYIINDIGTYYMFYGGHATGILSSDIIRLPDGRGMIESQICVMTSSDGRKWVKHLNTDGQSRLFVGPGEVRDPNLIKIDELWHLYYTGHKLDGNKFIPVILVRTSTDLINWSDYKVVHSDCSPRFGAGLWNTECPHVVERGGYYYLFRTEDYGQAKTHVFRSEDPYDFGIGNAEDKYVGMIAAAAPEIIVDADGNEFITSNHNLQGGTMLCRLKWVDAE